MSLLEQGSAEVRARVCAQVGTTPAQLRADVGALRDWLNAQPHLPHCAGDTMLTVFLIASKNRMERAKQKIDNYYTARAQMTDIFGDRDPTAIEMKQCAETVRYLTLPKLTPDGCRVTLGSLKHGDADKYNMLTYVKRMMYMEDLKINTEPFVRGSYYVFDCTDFSLAHVFKLSPSLARNLIHCAQDVLPIIIKGLIFINSPTFIDIFVGIMKPFMKGKLVQKIITHTEGPEILEKYFPKSMLPKDYGGEEDTRDNLSGAWMKLLEENRDWFLNEGSAKSDEKKRISFKTMPKHYDGIQGSFKTLCID